jgi:uncharacterized RDD family membrane protein YckC
MSHDEGRPHPPPEPPIEQQPASDQNHEPPPPVASLPIVTVETLPPASIGDRLVAQLVDGLLAFGLFVFLTSLLIPWMGERYGTLIDPRLAGVGIALAATALVLLVYFILFESRPGMTLGKIAAGVRVRDKSGGRISGRASFVRNVVRVFEAMTLYLVSALLIISTKRGQRVGDLMAGSVVIRHLAPRPVRALALLLAILVAAGGVLGGIAMSSLEPFSPERLVTMPPIPQPSPSPTGSPRIANAIVTDSRTSDVNRTSFSPQTQEIFVRFMLADVPPGSQLRAVWVAEQAAGIPSGQTLDDTTSSDAGGTQSQGVFSYPRPPNGWPLGTYRVDLFLNGQFERAVRLPWTSAHRRRS